MRQGEWRASPRLFGSLQADIVRFPLDERARREMMNG
jgi:hypothetical protein